MWSRRPKKCFKVKNMTKQLKGCKKANINRGETEADWLIATFRPSSRTGLLQILDYQLKRVDFDDLRGLEIVIIALLSSFVEYKEGQDASIDREPARPSKEPAKETLRTGLAAPLVPPPKPTTPPREERIQANEPNDLTIQDSIRSETYVKACMTQFADKSLQYVTLRAQTADVVQKVCCPYGPCFVSSSSEYAGDKDSCRGQDEASKGDWRGALSICEFSALCVSHY